MSSSAHPGGGAAKSARRHDHDATPSVELELPADRRGAADTAPGTGADDALVIGATAAAGDEPLRIDGDPAQSHEPRCAAGPRHTAGAVSAALTRAEAHALRRSEPLKQPVVAPPPDDRARRLRAERGRDREEQAPYWDAR